MTTRLISSREIDIDMVSLSGNQGLLLDSSALAWVVQDGKADIYTAPVSGNRPNGRLIHLFRAEMGQTMFGIDYSFGGEEDLRLIVTGIQDTLVLRRTRSELLQKARERGDLRLAEPAAYMVESWVLDLYRSATRHVPPNRFSLFEPGTCIEVEKGEVIRPRGEIVWVKQHSGVSAVFGNKKTVLKGSSVFFPLAGNAWIEVLEAGRVECRGTLELVDLKACEADCPLWQALDYFQAVFPVVIADNIRFLKSAELEKLDREMETNRLYMSRAFEHLEKAVLKDDILTGESGEDPLLRVCRIAAGRQGITVKTPPSWIWKKRVGSREVMGSIAQASGIRCREVELTGEWWRQDNGPLVVFRENDYSPLAMIPLDSSTNELYDPETENRLRLNSKNCTELHSRAYMFYRPFPNRALTIFDVLKFSFGSVWQRDLFMTVLMSIFSGLLGLALPLATVIVFGQVIPAAAKNELVFIAQFLIVSAFAVLSFNLVRSFSIMRLESRVDSTLQAAIWDRLLKLPLSFFSRHQSGDLGNRTLGIYMVRHILSGVAANTLFVGIFSLINLLAMYYFIPSLFWIAMLLVVVAMSVIISLGVCKARRMRSVVRREGAIISFLLQVFNGIARFRMAGAENRVFYLWAKRFARLKRDSYRSQVTGNYAATFSLVFPLFSAILIYLSFFTVGGGLEGSVPTAVFLAFSAAFTGMIISLMALSEQFIQIMQAVPLLERLDPIIKAVPETDETKMDPGELIGELELSRVTFHYNPDDLPAIDDVTLKIYPGQLAAIVGSSGSGKSTLFRMLLGFISPGKGTVYYDGQDLSILDLRYVRRQIGVVLQNDRLMPGSVLQNILGASNLALEDAWEAARLAGIDRDIREMPMGMHTYIAEGGSTFSGGQQQRLLIARAIVKKPRIIMFDEATSALDNRTQELVSRSMEELKATRVVVAHRLSSVINADVIFVMDRGRIVQKGTYEDLISKKGLFRTMAERQIL